MTRPFLTQLTLVVLAFAVTACSGRGDDGPVRVSIIDGQPLKTSQALLRPASAVVTAATAQGLVRFDAAGQIEPGLARRWGVSEDGLFCAFRLDEDAGISAEEVARRMRGMIAERSRNPLRLLLGAIDEIVAVTPEVVELRLHAPRPHLLMLLAQPEMALLGKKGGTGPFRIDKPGAIPLRLIPMMPEDPSEEQSEEADERDQLLLRSDRAGLAVARYADRQADLVLGGSYANLAIARAAQPGTSELRFDPATGLFGLAVVSSQGLLIAPENRRALAMAIDRDRIISAFGVPDWKVATTIIPDSTTEIGTPIVQAWSIASLAERRRFAAAAIARWRAVNPAPPPVRVALPEGPGSQLLFAALRADWAAIGVTAIRVGWNANADLRLIDEVAPASSASWYLRRFSCGRNAVCSEEADQWMGNARRTANMPERTARLTETATRLEEIVPFLPIAQPLRWSLVRPWLRAFQTNALAVHPLNHLRKER